MGKLFKSTVPDESDEERRELERYVSDCSCMFSIDILVPRLVAEAAKPKPKNKKGSARSAAGATVKEKAEEACSSSGEAQPASS